MNKPRMWGAAMIVAGAMVAQSVMAWPTKEYEPIDRPQGYGAPRGMVTTEGGPQREPEPVESPTDLGGAPRGQVSLESLGTSRVRMLAIALGVGRRAWLGW